MGARAPESLAVGPALFGTARQAVLRLLFGNADARFYLRQIIRSAALGSGAVQRELDRLTRAGILVRTVEGRQTYYQANARCPVFEELRGLIRKTFGVAEVLRASLAALAGRVQLAFVFGSVAAGTETAASDLDVLVVSHEISFEELVAALAPAEAGLGREVNPSLYRPAEFCRKLAQGRHFLSTVVAGPKVFLIGDESGLRGMAQGRLAEESPDKQTRNSGPVRARR